ncbi:unannotated protein [freshwater metagenome]|uniref:Unannotated protein n=1 Tax=freshwater metagenome TaxID=449393 RepID=A0A6J7S796_9ZZZZ
MLLVFGPVTRDGFVTKLRELHADFSGRNLIQAIADDRPVPSARSKRSRRLCNLGPSGKSLLHTRW